MLNVGFALALILIPLQTDAPPRQGEPVPSAQQPAPAPSAAPSGAPGDGAGFWPTERIVDLMMRRWADEVGQRYKLDERQRAEWGDRMSQRWTRFARENRTEMQPILSEFIEMRLEMAPPSQEKVKAWAERAAAAFDKLKTNLNEGADELRGLLRPGQRGTFDADMLGFNMGLRFAQGKLEMWKAGQFTEREFWDPPRSVREARRNEQEGAEGQGEEEEDAAAPQDPIEQELDAWQRYVERFTRLYALNEAQKSAAFSMLKELRERAIAHRDRYRSEIAELEKKIENPGGSPEDTARIEERLVTLYGPIDEMFNELKTRLESLPTQAQRDSAAKRDPDEEDNSDGRNGEEGGRPRRRND